MAKVEQEILVKIKTIVEGLNEVKAYSNTIKNLGKPRKNSLTSDFIKGGAAAGAMGAAVTKLISALETVGRVGAQAVGSFVEEGIRFNAVIESSRIGIATLVANTYDVRDAQGNLLAPLESFNAALQTSDQLERALQKAAIETKFEFQDLLTFFNSTIIASAGLKTNLQQAVRLTQDFALAAGAANIDVEKVNTGIQQILTGNTTVRNQLSRVIFPGLGTREINDTLKKYKEAGTLVDFLEKKLEVFRLSADQVSQSFDAVASNAQDALKVFEAAATVPLFNKLKETFGFIINQIVDLSGDAVKLTPTFQKIADILGSILGFIGDRLLEAVKAVFVYITYWADYLYANRDAIESITVSLYTLLEQVGGIASDLLGIITDLGGATSQTGSWAEKFQYAALFVGFIRDLLNIVIGLIEQAVGGVLMLINPVKYLTDALNHILDILDQWIGRVTTFSSMLRSAASYIGWVGEKQDQFGTGLFGQGYDRMNRGLGLQGLYGAQDRLTTLRFAEGVGSKSPPNYSFTPRTNLNRNAPGAGAASRERAEHDRLRDAQRLYNEIEKYQIGNANRMLAVATASNKALLEAEQRRYEKGLNSAAAYYARKAEIENTDLDNQKTSLEKQMRFAETTLSRNLGAIAGQFDLTKDAVDAIIQKITGLTEVPGGLAGADETTIKQAIEYTKYLEQTADITNKLNLIDQKRLDIQADLTEATEKQARVNRTMFDGLVAELASSKGDSGLGELYNLQKRVSDEFPRILMETSKAVPGIEMFAKTIRDVAAVDASNIPALLQDAGIKFADLSDEARVFVKLMERLQTLARLKSIAASVEQAKEAFKFATTNTQSDFDAGRIGLSGALQQNSEAKRAAVERLTAAYTAQVAQVETLRRLNIVTDADVRGVEELRRLIQELNSDLSDLNLIKEQGERDQARFSAAAEAIDLRRQSGDISAKQARRALLDLQMQQIAALEQELQRLLALDQTNIQVQQRVAETQNKLAQVRNEANAEAISFAQGLNGTIGDAFSTFLDTIQSGTASIGEAFRSLLASLLLGIAKAIAQALLLKFILAPLGLTGGDSGGLGGFFSGLISGKKAEGGIISGAGTGVSDTAGLYALSHGEGVIPARRVRQYGVGLIQSIISGSFIPRLSVVGFAGGGFPAGAIEGGRGGTRIVNAIDPNLVRDFLSSAQGEEIVLNIIGKNPGVVQRLV